MRKIKPLTMTKVKIKAELLIQYFGEIFIASIQKRQGLKEIQVLDFLSRSLDEKRQHCESGMSCSVSPTSHSALATAELVAERCCSLEISQGFRQFYCTLFLVYLFSKQQCPASGILWPDFKFQRYFVNYGSVGGQLRVERKTAI